MSFDPPEDFTAWPGAKLATEAKRADRALGADIDRLRIADERFRAILDRSLAIEAEQLRRRNK